MFTASLFPICNLIEYTDSLMRRSDKSIRTTGELLSCIYVLSFLSEVKYHQCRFCLSCFHHRQFKCQLRTGGMLERQYNRLGPASPSFDFVLSMFSSFWGIKNYMLAYQTKYLAICRPSLRFEFNSSDIVINIHPFGAGELNTSCVLGTF